MAYLLKVFAQNFFKASMSASSSEAPHILDCPQVKSCIHRVPKVCGGEAAECSHAS